MKFGVRGRLIFEGLEGYYETPYLIKGWGGGGAERQLIQSAYQ